MFEIRSVSGYADLADLRLKAFALRGADPHRFDGNGDGVGCES